MMRLNSIYAYIKVNEFFLIQSVISWSRHRPTTYRSNLESEISMATLKGTLMSFGHIQIYRYTDIGLPIGLFMGQYDWNVKPT